MIGISPSTPIYLCTVPCDMRKFFNGLCGLVRDYMGKEPVSGHMFVFVNRFCDRMKILFWDRHGFWIFYKRLEQGSFQMPPFSEHPQPQMVISYEQLLLIIEGIGLNMLTKKAAKLSLALFQIVP